MLRQFAAVLTLAATLAAAPALASDPVGQPGRGGDGHCPIPTLTTDPDCVREGAEEYQEQTKSSQDRDKFPRCRNGRAGQPLPPGCRRAAFSTLAGKSDRDQFPGGRPRQPIHLG